MTPLDRHARGVLLIGLSAVAFSSAGFFTRLVQRDAWTVLFWRGVFAGVMMLAVIVLQHRRATWTAIRAVGAAGLGMALCSTAATVLYINAFRHTSVADVVVILALLPFVTAALGWLVLGLIEAWTTIAASLAALLGVGIMVKGAVAAGDLSGDVLALGAVFCIAAMTLILRHRHATPMLPAACLSALLCPLLVWPFAAPLSVDAGDLGRLFLFGTTQFGLGLVLLTLGGRLISATENALISTLETPLAVAWVWACFGEAPSAASLTGGVVVLAAVVAHVWYGGRSRLVAAFE